MSLASVLQLINTEIVPNGNNEIDAITLQDVLVKMLLQPNELIGLLSNLQTVDKTDLVAAINELVNDIGNINVINVTQGIPNPNNNPGLTPQTADFYRQLTGGGALVGMWIYNSEKWILLSDEYISFAVNQGLNAGQQQIGRDNLDVYSKNETNSAISTAFLGLGNIVNSVNGVNVDNTDPKNPIIATFRPLADYQNDMLLKADIDGGLTRGGIWWQDQVLSDRFANYKQVWTALSNNTIEWGNIELDKHIFLVDDIDGMRVRVGGTDGTIWNTLNLTNVSQLNNDAGYLQANDLDGFIYDVQYNSATHTITFYQQNEPNIVIDLPIEQLIKGVQLVGDDLVFTFEDGSTVTVPLNTLLVGVVKSVNGLTPNSQGEIVLNIADIPALSSELSNKLDIRMAGLVSNLTSTEQSDIRTKLGIINNVVQTLGLSGNTLSLSGGGGSVNLGIANIGGLQAALNAKVDLDGSNSTGALLDSINKRHDAVTLGANSIGLNLVGQVLQFSTGYQLPTSNEITNWNNLVGNIGNYALNNGSNLTSPATWRINLSLYSISQVDGLLSGKVDLDGSNSTGNLADAISRRHDAVTLGTANGLSLSGQVLSMALAGALTTGTLTSTDWNNFNNKLDASALNGYATEAWANNRFSLLGHTHNTSEITALTGYVLGTNTALSSTDSLNTALGKIQAQINAKTSNLGTVTSITAGTGLSGGTITTSGTIALNSATLASLALANSALQVETDPIFTASPAYGITAGNISAWNAKQSALTNGLHTILNGNKIDVAFDINTPVTDKNGDTRLIFGDTQSNDVVIKGAVANGNFTVEDSLGDILFYVNGANKVTYFPQLPAPQTNDGNLAILDSGNGLWKHSTKISDLVTMNALTPLLNAKANANGNNITNIQTWQDNLGITSIINTLPNKANTDASNLINTLQWRNNLSVYSIASVDSLLNGKANLDGGNITNPNNWKLTLGYLTSETDPIFTASVAYNITSSDITNWNSKTSNLGTVTGITAGSGLSGGIITTNGTIALNSATLASLALADSALQSSDNISLLTNDAGYITSGALGNYVDKAGDTMTGSLIFNGNEGVRLNNSQWGITYNSNLGGINFVRYGFTDGVFFIKDNENVGVNTVNPLYKFDVVGNGRFTDNLIVPNATASNHAVAFGQLGDYFKHEYTGGISNGSASRTNQSWFDYNPMGMGGVYNGIVASFDGLSTGYRLEIHGRYDGGGNIFFIRTRNGDINQWNPTREIITDYNINGYINAIVGNYALANGTNISNIAGWQTTLGVGLWGGYRLDPGSPVNPTHSTLYDASTGHFKTATLAEFSNWLSLSNYALLSQVPTNNNQLANGANYITSAALAGYALISQIPTDNAQLSNGAGYITAASLPTVNNGALIFSVSADFAAGAFNFSANQAGNTNSTLSLSAAIKSDIALGVSAYNSLGNYLPIGKTITINGITQLLNNNPVFTVSAIVPPRTTENITVSGGGFVSLNSRKTRVTIMDSGVYDIPNGTEDGDSLFIVFCEAGGDFTGQINIKHMNKCLDIRDEILFNSNESFYFWWSEVDGCWLGLLI